MQHTISSVLTHFSFGHPDKYSLVTSAGQNGQLKYGLHVVAPLELNDVYCCTVLSLTKDLINSADSEQSRSPD